MGQFSWYTQDTHRRIQNGQPLTVYMSDDKGNKYKETCYQGYGIFGGKDYYALLAEMNGITVNDNEVLRLKGIELAFKNSPRGNNPEIKHPSLTEDGLYYHGEPPIIDAEQGFPLYLSIAAVPANMLKQGWQVMLPQKPTFKVNNRDVKDVEVAIETMELYETVIIEDKFPFTDYIVEAIRPDGWPILKNPQTAQSFTYSGNVLILADKIVHSYIGNQDVGDLVKCNDCETLLLVPQGTDICPSCRSYGCLGYPDYASDHVQASQADLIQQGKIVIQHDRPEDELLFSSYL